MHPAIIDKSLPRNKKPELLGATTKGISKTGLAWSIHNGDAFKVLSSLPNESVNCVVTSPPYYWLRDYGVSGQIGLEETVEDYVTQISNVMDEVKRVLRKDGLLFLNIGDTYYSGKGKSHGTDKKSSKRRFGLRAVDKSGGLGIGLQRKIYYRNSMASCD
jgi:DNA modification methylase